MRPLEELRLDINRDLERENLVQLDGFRQKKVTESDQDRDRRKLR